MRCVSFFFTNPDKSCISLALTFLSPISESVDKPYPAHYGIYREEAIMLLRRFYIQENEKAPEPKQKKTRELKTDIIPLAVANKDLIEGLKKREDDGDEEKGDVDVVTSYTTDLAFV